MSRLARARKAVRETVYTNLRVSSALMPEV
jgi:hypothetical protein